jgi:hypothetical protein
MTKQKMWTCPTCDEQYPLADVESGEVNTHFGNVDDQEVCWGCYESDEEHASTVIRYQPGDQKEVVRYTEHHATDDTHGDEPPDWFWKYFGGRKYVATDGWRGYQETTWKNGFVSIANGWVTGYPDDTVSYKKTASDLHEFMEEHQGEVPVPVYWVFEPTSNVFSTASEIFVDKDDKDKLVKWLQSNGFDIEDIETSFH